MELNKGEVICPECNGDGVIKTKCDKTVFILYCRICLSTKKVDWIQNIQMHRKKMWHINYKIINISNTNISISKEFKKHIQLFINKGINDLNRQQTKQWKCFFRTYKEDSNRLFSKYELIIYEYDMIGDLKDSIDFIDLNEFYKLYPKEGG